ncbi:PAS domain S-box protein [Leptodesmis sp.]|uniref:PAS domain S-box protein n=1 Tax=Leptodesmis sp. TaxID=3100501 RepID=UPI0040535557
MTIRHRQLGNQLPLSVKAGFILIADHQRTNLSVLSEVLDAAGLCYRSVTNGESVLALVEQHQPTLILLDVEMPGIDGFEICRQLKANPLTQAIPVILTMPLTDTASKAKGFSLGAIDYLPKPFEPTEVIARLRVHLQLQQLTQSPEDQIRECTLTLQQTLSERQPLEAERQSIEIACQQTEVKLHRLATHLPGMLYQFKLSADGSMSLPYVSSGCQTLYGLDPVQLQRDPNQAIAMIHPEDQESFQQSVALSAQTLQPWQWTGRFITASGQQKWIQGMSSPERLENGDTLWHGFLLDVSDRKQLEADRNAALAELQQKLQMLDACNDAIMIRGLDGVISYWNQGAQRLYGWTSEDAIGKVSHTLFQTQFPHPLDTIMAELEQHQHWEGELTHMTRDGRELIVFSRWALQRDDQGTLIAIVETNNDITTRKQAEAALRTSEQRFRDVTEAAGEYIWEINADGVYTFVTDRAKDVKGYSPTELLGHTLFKFMPPEDIADVMAIIQAAAVSKSPFTLEHRNCLPNGEVVWESVRGVPLFNEQDEVIGFRGTGLSITERKQAEADLQAQEQLLRSMYEGVEHSIILVDVSETGEFRLMEWNRAAEKLTGISSAAIAGKTPEEVWGETQGAIMRQNYQRCVQAGTAITYEECVTFQARTIWRLTTLNPLKDERGHIYRIVITAFDITERKAAEQSQARLTAILESTSDLVGTADMQGNTLYLNQAGKQLLEIPPEEDVVGLPISTTVPEWAKPIVLGQGIPTALQTGIWKGEVAIVSRSGQEIPVSQVIIAHKAADGTPEYLSTIIRDITEQKQAEICLKQQAQREQLLNRITTQIRSSLDFNMILTTALDEIRQFLQLDACIFAWCHLDAEKPYWHAISESRAADMPSYLGRYPLSSFSTLGERILGLEIIQVDDASATDDPLITATLESLGMQAALILPVQFSPTLLQIVFCGNRQVRAWTTDEIDIVQAVMEQLAIALNQVNLYEQSQARATELAATLQELQRTQAQLVQNEKMSSLGQLVAGIAHEINNPVNFIYGNLNHLEAYSQDLLSLIHLYRREYPQFNPAIATRIEEIDLEFLSEDLLKILDSMKVGADRIRGIVRSLRIFSRLDEAEVKAVDIHEGIDSTLIILQSRLKANLHRPAIQVIKNYGSLPQIECFAGQLNQVFMNILANAIDALEERIQQQTPEAIQQTPSTITITTALDPEHQAIIKIADNGIGMPESVQRRLFDPFFTTKPVGQGTGMGLSISYQIITEKHQGTLTCTSSPGQGTEFVIRIPLKLH